MKRLWIGIGVLLVLLIFCCVTAWALGSLHQDLADLLDQAALLVQSGQMKDAEQTIAQAQALWEKHHHLAAAFADHEPLEQIDSLFARLKVYCKAEDGTEIAAACVELSSISRDVAESHGLAWWSVL